MALGQPIEQVLIEAHSLGLGGVRKLRMQPFRDTHEEFAAVIHVRAVARLGHGIARLSGRLDPEADHGMQFLDRIVHRFSPGTERA